MTRLISGEDAKKEEAFTNYKTYMDAFFKAEDVKLNIDIAAGKRGVGWMRIGTAGEIAPGKPARSAPGNQVIRLYNGNTCQ